MTEPAAAVPTLAGLPLFPLQMVLFPGGLLRLKVFEARYLDLISDCLRTGSLFAVVCLLQGSEAGTGAGAAPAVFESVGVLSGLLEVDAEQAGILRASCLAGQRVRLGRPSQRSNGLWQADASACAQDTSLPVPEALVPSAVALRQAMTALAEQGQQLFVPPYRMDDAGWVANRWCELLPISLAAKQRLMVLDDPLLRLKLVDEYLRGQSVVG